MALQAVARGNCLTRLKRYVAMGNYLLKRRQMHSAVDIMASTINHHKHVAKDDPLTRRCPFSRAVDRSFMICDLNFVVDQRLYTKAAKDRCDAVKKPSTTPQTSCAARERYYSTSHFPFLVLVNP